MEKKILVIGATGQIGSELTIELRKKYGKENVLACSHQNNTCPDSDGPYVCLDATNKKDLEDAIKKYKINEIYHLAAMLSVTGEQMPMKAWNVNMNSLINVLELAKEHNIKVFWPSSIAVFGPTTPKNAPQETILEPSTMYGITKVAGELLCSYYKNKFEVDVRSLRFPGIVSYKTRPGGGTTDYAVAIFYEAIKNKYYNCFVSEQTKLPMMYMPDCIKSIIKLMEAPKERLRYTCYNVAAMSFSAKELYHEIKKNIPDFKCVHNPDFRQKIADSWPQSIDDSAARKDWNWKPDYDLSKMASEMLQKISEKLKKC